MCEARPAAAMGLAQGRRGHERSCGWRNGRLTVYVHSYQGSSVKRARRSPGAQGTPDARRTPSGAGGGGGGGTGNGSAGMGGEGGVSASAEGGYAAARAAGDAAPLGRSPQRGIFVPANHLLNFQYDSRAAVCASANTCNLQFDSRAAEGSLVAICLMFCYTFPSGGACRAFGCMAFYSTCYIQKTLTF